MRGGFRTRKIFHAAKRPERRRGAPALPSRGRLERRRENEVLLGYDVTVEIEGGSKPALAALWLTLAVLGG